VNAPFDNRRVSAAQVGVCSASQGEQRQGDFVLCRYAFRSPPSDVSVYFSDFKATVFREAVSYSPFPAELSVSPVSQYFAYESRLDRSHKERASTATLVTMEPVAHIRRDFEIGGLRLAEFEATMPPSP
jgi:hypothetical protein